MTSLPPASLESNRYGARRRVSRGAWALAILLHVAFIALLIFQKGPTFVKMSQRGLDAFLLPAAPEGVDKSKSETKQKQLTTQEQTQSETPPPPPATTPPPPEVPAPSNLKMPFIEMSSADFAASNIARIQSQKRGTGTAQLADSRAPAGPGAAPGGGSLYPADWYREPTDAELGFYVKPGQPSKGWGQIACKTIERFKVDECYIMGESPMGSGFGRSVLNAAWQFLILPPRVNGTAQVGTWVSIRITYSPAGNRPDG